MRQIKFRANTETLKTAWQEAWPKALALWNSIIKLREPVWCLSDKEAEDEGLSGSFAMIRLTDHLVVSTCTMLHFITCTITPSRSWPMKSATM